MKLVNSMGIRTEENLVTVVTDTGMEGPDVGVIEGDVVIATA